MDRTNLKTIYLQFFSCIALLSFLLLLPMASYGQEPCPMGVEVSPYQVNIDGGGVEHYVRILTYTSYSNTEEAFVYINDSEDPIEAEYIELTRDSAGHLIVKIFLEALQNAGLETDTIHYLKIAVVLKEAVNGCVEKEGVGEIHIVGKQGKM